MTGKLKTKGNMMLATKLQDVLKVCWSTWSPLLALTCPSRRPTRRRSYKHRPVFIPTCIPHSYEEWILTRFLAKLAREIVFARLTRQMTLIKWFRLSWMVVVQMLRALIYI